MKCSCFTLCSHIFFMRWSPLAKSKGRVNFIFHFISFFLNVSNTDKLKSQKRTKVRISIIIRIANKFSNNKFHIAYVVPFLLKCERTNFLFEEIEWITEKVILSEIGNDTDRFNVGDLANVIVVDNAAWDSTWH